MASSFGSAGDEKLTVTTYILSLNWYKTHLQSFSTMSEFISNYAKVVTCASVVVVYIETSQQTNDALLPCYLVTWKLVGGSEIQFANA